MATHRRGRSLIAVAEMMQRTASHHEQAMMASSATAVDGERKVQCQEETLFQRTINTAHK